MNSTRRAFVVMPFGVKKGPDGTDINFDEIYKQLLAPAIAEAGLTPTRADADRRGGSIHLDMFQELLLAEFVVADVTLDNPNVWYELGVRHALRAGGAVIVHAHRDRLPFDIAGQRVERYELEKGALRPAHVEREREELVKAIEATLGAWRGRRASPVYQQLPSLKEPDWKSLKVGAINEFWQALDNWQSRIVVATKKQRPGDILLLAEETPNSVLEFEALRTAGRALLKLKQPRYALAVLERARKLNEDDVEARQQEAVALGRCGRYPEARESLRRLAEVQVQKDGETLGLLARTWKDEWREVWYGHPDRKTDPLKAARDTEATLHGAAATYADAFYSAPGDYFPGINALTLGRLWEHVTGRTSSLPLDLIASGVRWTVDASMKFKQEYYSVVTRAELALIEGRRDEAMNDYGRATALAIAHSDLFALDASSQQLDFLAELQFRPELVKDVSELIDRAERQLASVGQHLPAEQAEPKNLVVFTGHMIDNPKVRGEGKPKPERFPASKIDAAADEIRKALEEIHAGRGDIGLCGGASGGDLLFAEACLERGMSVELRLARPEAKFLAESVTFADPNKRWEKSFSAVKKHPLTRVFVMPEELGPAPEGISVHDRCNRWILHSALSRPVGETSFIALWNGEPGDGPGGTQHMVETFDRYTGRKPTIIDPLALPKTT